MGPEAAVNAVFANKIAAIDDPAERETFVEEQRRLYEEDVDLFRLASELVIDAVVDFGDLRHELVTRLARASGKDRHFSTRRHGVPPVCPPGIANPRTSVVELAPRCRRFAGVLVLPGSPSHPSNPRPRVGLALYPGPWGSRSTRAPFPTCEPPASSWRRVVAGSLGFAV